MDGLIRFFVRRHLVVHIMVGTVVALGWATASRTAREGMPNVAMPLLIVDAALQGASVRDVETKVTIPLEEAIDEIDGIKTYHTVVTDHHSTTTIELFDDYDEAQIRDAEQDVRDAIDAVTDFPPEMEDKPRVKRVNPGKMPVLEIALSGPIDAVREAAQRITRRLRPVEGVAQVIEVGLQDPEVRVLLDPVRARGLGVALGDVMDAIERRDVSSTGGLLETADARRQVVLWSRLSQPEHVGDVILRFRAEGGAVRVADVARIESAYEDTGLLAHTNGEPGVSLVVRKRQSADILNTVDAVRAALETTPLPEGVDYALVNDESFETRNRLSLMLSNGTIGAVLVVAILFTFLTPSAALWVMVGIPFVFLGILVMIPRIGMTLNIVSLAGFVVVLGMLVDDAVVVAERIVARRQEGFDPEEAAARGAAEVARPVIAAAVTTVLAFLPMWAIGGIAGRVAWNIPAVVILALVFSLFESFLILPAHLSGSGSRAPVPKRAFVLRLEARYRTLLCAALRQRGRIALGALGLFLAISLGLLPRVGFVIFPQDDADAVYMKVTLPLGTPLERTEAMVTNLERQLPALLAPDLLAVTGRIGHGETDRLVSRERGSSENEAVVSALFRNEDRERTCAEWIQVLEERLVVPEGVKIVYEAERIGPAIGMPVTVHVESDEDGVRRMAAAEVAGWLRDIEGITNVDVDERPGTPQLDLNLDYERLALRGLDATDVGRTLAAAFHGIRVSEHRDLDETTGIRVLFDPSARRDLASLLEVPVRSRSGDLVRLRDVVRPADQPGLSEIHHRDGHRTATVVASFVPGSEHTAVSMARRIDAQLVPRFGGVPGLRVYSGGEATETDDATGDLKLALAFAVCGITLVIAAMLGSLIEALLVVSVVPFAGIWVAVTFFAHGKPLSLLAMVGTIGLTGVVVNASILMVDAIRRHRADAGPDPTARAGALVDAVVERLRPILVTTLTTLGGVLPTAYGLGGYDAVVSPMSLALGWGLALSTLTTLILVPVLVALADDLRAFARQASARPRAAGWLQTVMERLTPAR